MAQDTALWDDAALINAFNSAMTKYKVMHNKSSKDTVIADAENGIEIHEEELSKAIRSSEERNEETMGATSRQLHASLTDSGEAGEAEPLQDFSAEQLQGTENVGAEHTWPSGQMSSADEQHIHLVNNYYELEKQRQEVLRQLYQLNGWNHQATNEQVDPNMQWSGCGQWGQDASYNSLYPPMQAYCHPYSHCWLDQPLPCMGPCATCSSLSAGLTNNNQSYCHCQYKNSMHSPSGRNTVEPSKTSIAADGLANTILEVVKKATSTVKAEMPRGDDICEGELKVDNLGEGSSSSDITEMLHAWFLAGFTTARYLYCCVQPPGCDFVPNYLEYCAGKDLAARTSI